MHYKNVFRSTKSLKSKRQNQNRNENALLSSTQSSFRHNYLNRVSLLEIYFKTDELMNPEIDIRRRIDQLYWKQLLNLYYGFVDYLI